MNSRNEQWKALDEKIFSEMSKTMGGKEAARKYTDEMISELKDLYKIYKPEIVDWFANLYEPNIQFTLTDSEDEKKRYSGGAGFYYSNSARDNYSIVKDGVEYQLLPDAETTAQVFGFLRRSGMLSSVGGDVREAFPESEQKKIIRFIKALQDKESGNFYHPQWLSMLGTPDFWDSRRARDMNYGTSVLKNLGASPTYDTPAGVKGDGILYDGTSVAVKEQADPVGHTEEEKKPRTVHKNLVSLETFEAYLNTLNLSGNSYFVGNELSSLSLEILKRDKEVGTPDDPRPFSTMLDRWMRSNQNPETGVWHDNEKHPVASIYYPINGVLKIATMYNNLMLPFPNPLAAAKSAFEVITGNQPINHVCDLYNTWFTVDMIVENLRKYSGDGDLAKKIVSDVRVAAIPAIRATREKMKDNRCEDGSFHYSRIYKFNCSEESPQGYSLSQNAPVAPRNKVEGDVNATTIFTYGILGFMFGALDFGEMVPICDADDLEKFRSLIEKKSSDTNEN